jgi:hypothetical protein
MAFPTTALDVKVELSLNSVWTDITSKVYTRSPIQITRGRQDESSRAEPGRATLVLNNRDGRFSPRNPTGLYYGTIGRNTPVRISARVGSTRLAFPASAGVSAASAPDTAALSITGDLDLRVDLNLPSWPFVRLLAKADTVGQSSYRIVTLTGNYLSFVWSTDGTTEFSATSTVPLPQSTGRQAVRATIDVDNGAAGRTITFYTAPTLSGTWTQLGDPVVQAGVTSIFDSTSTLAVLRSAAGFAYGAQVLQGIGGTVRASPDFTVQTEGATSFADAQGNTWTLAGGASITNRRYRFYGEISSWPQGWDLSGNDVWVSVEAAGIMRRLIAGSDPLKSSIQRFVLRNASTAYAYWPMDDEAGSTSIASGLAAGPAMSIAGAPNFAADSTFVSSNPLLTLAGAALTGPISPMAATGTVYVQMLLAVPAAGEASDGVFLRVFTTGTASRWDIAYTAATDLLRLDVYDNFGASLLSTSTGFSPNGKPLSMILNLAQNGANIDWRVDLNGYVNPTAGIGPTSGTLAGQTVGVGALVQVNPTLTLTDSTVGHLYVFAARQDGTTAEISALRGNVGETAGRRVERLCGEESIAFAAYGDLDQTVAMGAQRPLSLVELLAECETADMGQVFESREQFGLAYRTRDSRQYQGAALALAYGNLSELVPVEDDQATHNDITVSRSNGSSARVTLDAGALSTLAPPNGVGRYAQSLDINIQTDAQLSHQAQWRITEGTVDEARYPSIVTNLERSPFTSSATKTDGALSVDHGDLITITGLPAWLPPDTVRVHTIGQTETLGVTDYGIAFVCIPATPAGATGLYDDGSTRYAPSGSTLGGLLTSTATGAVLTITTAAGNPIWTTNAADFPMDVRIAGEVITISGITGSSSPQTGTITARSVNGVVKAQSAGAAIDIAAPNYYSL